MAISASHVWRPSSARVVAIDSFVPVPRGAATTPPPAPAWAAKDPGDILDYVLDVSPALAGNEGDSISAIDVAISPGQPGDLALNSAAADGNSVILWLSGGQADTTYAVTITVATASGRTLCRTVRVPVVRLAAAPAPVQAIKTDTGSALTDQSGNPVLAV